MVSERCAGFETCDTAGLEACATGQCQDAPNAYFAELSARPKDDERGNVMGPCWAPLVRQP